MKIAFPVTEDNGLESRVNDHFGTSELFLVVDLDTGEIQTRTNRKIDNPDAGCKTGIFDKADAVEAVVTKCIGDGGQRNLHNVNIRVYAAQKDTVGENLDLMKSGDLKLFHMFDLCQGKKNKKQGDAAIIIDAAGLQKNSPEEIMENPEEHAYLTQLYTMSNGDPGIQVSMYEIGAALGLEKSEAGTLAESLFIQDLAELKTLSGGIAITESGLKALGRSLPDASQEPALTLGRDLVLDPEKTEMAAGLLAEIKTVLERETNVYSWVEEVVMDIKTMEVQLLSPKPKTGIVREIFTSLHRNLKQTKAQALNKKLSAVLSA